MLWRLTGPNVLGVVMTILVTFCDAWFVADLGTVALASLALVFPFRLATSSANQQKLIVKLPYELNSVGEY